MVKDKTNKVVKKQRNNSPFDFLFSKIDEKEDVKIYLRDNEETIVYATIISFDAYTILVEDNKTKKRRLLFKHNINEISER